MAHAGDVTQLHGGKLPPVDIVTFGSPCQGLSMAGQRRGLADERSGLFMEAIRIIDEMREATHGEYPRFALFENVPGALSSAGGRDFAAVLQSFTKTEIPMPYSGRWANAGMVRGGGVDLAWCVYDAQYFGTAQRRRRLFLVCDFAGKCAGEILFVPKSLRGYFEAGGTPRQGAAAFAESRPDTAGAGTLTAGNGRYQFIPQKVEILNDQGGESLSVERTGIAPTLRSQTHGNLPVIASALCVGSGQAHAGILDNQSPTLTAAHEQPIVTHPQIAGTLCASGAGLSRPAGQGNELDFCVVSAGFKHKAGSQSGSIGFQEETAPTLLAGQQSAVMKAYVVGAYHSGGMLSDNPKSGFYEADTSRTLDLNGGNPCCNQGGVAVVEDADGAAAVDCRNLRETDEVSGTLLAKAASGGYSLNYQNPVRTGLCVRRLTPTEAERLQGYPDGWTESGADGRAISDTKRYQMLGNSIAVPCVAYIMQGIRDAVGGE